MFYRTFRLGSSGKLTKEVQKDGTTTKYTYDKVGNEKKITYSDNRSVSYTYTSTNQVKTMNDWNDTTTYEYDANGQVTKVTDGKNQTIGYTWTKLGQKKSIKYPTGDSVSYTYDNNGNLTKVTDTNSGVTNYTYDALNQVKTKNLPNGAESTYTYDTNGWLTQREETSNGASKKSYTYEYDKNGNRTKETKVSSGTTETTRYTYDVLNQLISVVDKKGTRYYAFDEFNNRTVKEEIGKETTQYTYNNLKQLAVTIQGSTVTTYDYDKRGNVAKVEENGDTKQTYVFDSTNKMAKVVTYKDNTSGSGTSTVTTKYNYDGAGNKIGMKHETNGRLTSDIIYAIDPVSSYNDIIMAEDRVTGETSIFTFSNEVISVETFGNISYYRNDEKSSVTDILDMAGKVKATITYDEYGVIANPEVVSIGGNIFAYTGHVYEESTGLYYAKARYYDAGIGRFISLDSYVGEQKESISLNQYIYVLNNPIKFIDPSGYYSLSEGVLAHKQLQIYFEELYLRDNPHLIGFIEYPIYSKKVFKNKSGSGRADIVLLNGGTFEIYEIKPFSQRESGRAQLKNYVRALRETKKSVVRGITFNPNGLELTCPWNPNKVIKYYTYSNDKGMIYYSTVNIKKQPQEEPVTNKSKAKSPSKGNKIDYNKVRDGVVVVSSAYAIYRVARFIPSLFPAAWWTIPANLVTP
ncbi:RHS repeat-associated core domain-containing protein [Anaerosporobacter mobilis DSM 15930]|uniref:RHS repeat-associated core domain-containing protein n=1 Tax=Anaerosporobacter mobilis DSM 15930 TaxID=1120996 RepID=A0A1M7MC15_9FIRM|nr:RHS repeat-associated core domain-containing protein [Anaerosporobacter mobilis]SHM87859.1 RHS repeat-associated core domain-containing protein [Anaerosporobacter mobilis DSM 15930]